MEFTYYIGTRVIFGRGCIAKNGSEFGKLGKKALLVTGRNSARKSGALDDVCKVLESQGIQYSVFDSVENNPSLATVSLGGEEARRSGAQFVIGIGGGSPLDASKAIAVLAVNKMDPLKLYDNKYENRPLPIVAIPTTAGTGSEVTPYAILTRDDLKTKRSFGNQYTFPEVSFLDPDYTDSQSLDVTVNTAVDAFSHSMEGYLSKRSTPVSDIYAVEGARIFGQCVQALLSGKLDGDIREKLLYAAMLGGMVISHTGTTVVHSMGYNLTYFKDIPHGKANGYFIKEYLNYNYCCAREKIDHILEAVGFSSLDGFGTVLGRLLGDAPILTEEEVGEFSKTTMTQKSASHNIREVTLTDIVDIHKRVFFDGTHTEK